MQLRFRTINLGMLESWDLGLGIAKSGSGNGNAYREVGRLVGRQVQVRSHSPDHGATDPSIVVYLPRQKVCMAVFVPPRPRVSAPHPIIIYPSVCLLSPQLDPKIRNLIRIYGACSQQTSCQIKRAEAHDISHPSLPLKRP